MDDMFLNIISFNCKGFKNRNYSYLKSLSNKCDFLLLQETWLYKSEDYVIKNVLNNFDFCSVSSMDESNINHKGRPFGGCMVLWKNSLDLTINHINVNNNRICAVEVINKNNDKLLLLSVYMPVNDNSPSSILEFGDTLNEISALYQLYSDHKIIIGGDFNVDFNKNSLNNDILDNFCETEGVVSEFHLFQNLVNFTYESTMGHKSYIDHFLFSVNISNKIDNLKCMIDGDNLSDHHPLLIRYNFQFNYNCNISDNIYCRFDWKNTSNEYKLLYSQALDTAIERLDINNSILNCVDVNCTIHNDSIQKLLDGVIEVIIDTTELIIPKIKNNFKKGKPGWNEYVQPLKDKSIFWNDIWKSAGCPSSGQLALIRRSTRAKYHQAIKFIKKNEDHIIKCNISNSLNKKHFTQFWNIVRKIKSNKNDLNPSVIDNISGNNNIANLFKDKYQSIYNTHEGINSNMIVNENLRINNICLNGSCKTNHNINLNDVRNAVKLLKNNKVDHVYDISSDNIIYGSDSLFRILAIIFNAMLIHGFSFDKFNRSVVKLIVKDKKKSKSDSNNYRAISLSSIFLKLIEYIIIDKINKNLSSSNNQFAYKSNHSTIMSNFILDQTIEYYLSKKSEVFCVFLDATKAFDLIDHRKLFQTINNKNICPLFTRLIMILYKFNNAIVNYNNVFSNQFNISNGVKQGGILSPYLFSIYMDNLVDKLINTNMGCKMGDRLINCLMYADDIVLMAPSITALNVLLRECEVFSELYKVNFNPSKSSLMIFSNNNYNFEHIDVRLFDERIPIKNEVNYLGTILKNNRLLHDSEKCIHDMKIRCNTIFNIFYNTGFKCRAQLFKSQCMSLYGCELFNLDSNYIEKLYVNYRSCIRKILCIDKRTHCYLLPILINSKNLNIIIQERIINFFIKCLNHDNSLIKFVSEFVLTSNFSSMSHNVFYILNENSIPFKRLYLDKHIKLEYENNRDWRSDLLLELLNIRDCLLTCNTLNLNETNKLIKYLCVD